MAKAGKNLHLVLCVPPFIFWNSLEHVTPWSLEQYPPSITFRTSVTIICKDSCVVCEVQDIVFFLSRRLMGRVASLSCSFTLDMQIKQISAQRFIFGGE